MSDASKNQYFNEENIQTKLTFVAFAGRLRPFFKKHKLKIAYVLLIVVMFSIVGRALPRLFGYAVDEGIGGQNMNLIFQIAMAYLALEIIRAGLAFLQSYEIQRLGNRILFDLREKLIHHVQHLKLNYFDKNPIGRTVTRVTNDVASVGELFNHGFTDIFVNAIEIVTILIALSFVSFKLTLLTLLITPILLFASLKISSRIRSLFREVKKKLSTINAFTAESLNGMRVLQLFNRVPRQFKEFKQLTWDYRNLQVSTVKLFALLWPILDAFSSITVATAIFFGAVFRSEIGITVGELTAFILLLQQFFRPIRIILERYNQFQNSLASADRIFTLMDEPMEKEFERKINSTLKGSIEIKNLNFKYSQNGPYVLKNINLSIAPGEKVAIIGRTGSGKSTLISLLQKLYTYSEGQIFVDGVEINKINNQNLRKNIGVVQQDNFLFRGTINYNVGLGEESISKKQIESAVKMANAQQVIQRFDKGLDGHIEERGANLSVGERQLIAFSRVIAFNPPILILDEATSNIDSLNEERIQRSIKTVTENRTSLIIAHRLSTITHCDRILIMSEGEVIEEGNHLSLMNKDSIYKKMYLSQIQDDNNESRVNPDIQL